MRMLERFTKEDEHGIDGITATLGLALLTGIAATDGEIRQMLLEAAADGIKGSKVRQRLQAVLARRTDPRLAQIARGNKGEQKR